jgi:putative membrane protein
MLGLVAAVLDGFQLAGFWSALFGSVLISIFSAVGSNFIGSSGHIEVIVRRD